MFISERADRSRFVVNKFVTPNRPWYQEISVTEIDDNLITSGTMTACCSDKLNCSPGDSLRNKIRFF